MQGKRLHNKFKEQEKEVKVEIQKRKEADDFFEIR